MWRTGEPDMPHRKLPKAEKTISRTFCLWTHLFPILGAVEDSKNCTSYCCTLESVVEIGFPNHSHRENTWTFLGYNGAPLYISNICLAEFTNFGRKQTEQASNTLPAPVSISFEFWSKFINAPHSVNRLSTSEGEILFCPPLFCLSCTYLAPILSIP